MGRAIAVLVILFAGWAYSCGRIPPDLAQLATYYARAFGLEPNLLIAVVWVESRFCIRAVSPKGAVGLGQIMPRTGKGMGIDPARLTDPRWNLWGSARYLRQQWDTFRDWRLALAAYNAGAGAVRRFGGIPPFPETQRYVRDVLWIFQWLQTQNNQ
jgi:soluble lytic murein transglycosylase-like protein